MSDELNRRIVIVASYAPSLVNFRGPLIRALVARGYSVIAVAPAIDQATWQAIEGLGARPRDLPINNAGLNPFALWKSYCELRALIREQRPQAILSYTIKPVIVGAFAARAEGVAQVISMITGLGYAFTGTAGGVKRRLVRYAAGQLYRQAFDRSTIVLFQNPDDRELLKELGVLDRSVPSAVTAGSGVDLAHFVEAPLPNEVSFLMISRLLGDKGVREFVAASRRLLAAFPNVQVGLVGYVDASPDAISTGEFTSLADSGIRFYGRMDDVRPALARHSVYVLPSYREGTPRSVLEAMATGRAIITTDAPGCRETVRHELNGLLVPPRDAEALYAAMEHLVLHPEKVPQMARESRKIAESRYDVRKVNADIIELAGL